MTIKKVCNAFIPSAEASIPIGAVENFKKKHGGLWVGGNIELSPQGVFFKPNKLNQALHVELEEISIAMSDIEDVERVFGFVTGIVKVKHVRGMFLFRCFGAKSVASQFKQIIKK